MQALKAKKLFTSAVTFTFLVAFSLFGLSISSQAQVINPIPVVNDDWRFSASINGWAPASWVTASAGSLSKSADSSISDNINSAGALAMLTGEAHKGDWGILTDLVYWQMGGNINKTTYMENRFDIPNSLYAGVNTKATQTMLTIAGTYTAYKSDSLYLDALVGARYISSTTSLNATAKVSVAGASISTSGNPSFVNQTTDPLIGFNGRARIADTSWFIPFYADVGKGPGANNTTWQTLLGVGNAYAWGDITLAYRAMYFDLDSRVARTKFLNAGPQLAATFNF